MKPSNVHSVVCIRSVPLQGTQVREVEGEGTSEDMFFPKPEVLGATMILRVQDSTLPLPEM